MDPLRHLERIQRDIQENRDEQQATIMRIAALDLLIEKGADQIEVLKDQHQQMKAAFKPNFDPLTSQAPTDELRLLLEEACKTGFKEAWNKRELSLRFQCCELDTEVSNHTTERGGLSTRLVRLKRREQKLLLEHSAAITSARESLERLQNEVEANQETSPETVS
jgi:predicted  nucleic acid-binding Zn-ribbon protein